ncbi:hypothetical protein, partial [Gluconacetobacter sacchari]|uniref:hypothetical protein n=1 Tax=Gluconacetobacter sacchari TaxID=92759 RepID=UPI001C7E58D7
ICSKRRSKTNPKVVNQIAKNLKSPAKRINQGFFDPSRFEWNILRIAALWAGPREDLDAG